MKNHFLLWLTLAILSSCANQSAYQPAKANGVGYKDTALDATTYRVEYNTRSGSLHKAQDLALLRAAEITAEQGYDWFILTKRETKNNREKIAPAPLLSNREIVTRHCGLLACRTSRQTLPEMDAGPSEDETSEVTVILEINLGRGIRPKENSYEASEIIETLHKKYNLHKKI